MLPIPRSPCLLAASAESVDGFVTSLAFPIGQTVNEHLHAPPEMVRLTEHSTLRLGAGGSESGMLVTDLMLAHVV